MAHKILQNIMYVSKGTALFSILKISSLFIILRLFIGLNVMAVSEVYAETVITDDASIDDETDARRKIHFTKVKPVEVGVGGEIKVEKKYRTKAESLFEWHGHMHWESRYVTEGRDNLAGNGLASVSSEFLFGEFSVLPWIAGSPDTDYTEFNLNVIHGIRLTESLFIYGGYNFIRSEAYGEYASDNEISLDLSYKFQKRIQGFVSVYHSFDAGAAFLQTSVKYAQPVSGKLHFDTTVSLGVNAGYITDGHRGLNNIQLRGNMDYQLALQAGLSIYLAYNQALRRDAIQYAGDELLDNFFWGGVGFTYRF